MLGLDQVAVTQHGLVTRQQVLAGRSRWALRRAVAGGQLIPVSADVFRCAGAPASFRQRALAPCLAYGPLVAVSFSAAARMWDMEAVRTDLAIDVSIPHGRSGRIAGTSTHRVVLSEADVTTRFGIPVTIPGRTLLDLALFLPPKVLERSLDDVLRARHARAADLVEWLDSADRTGRRGTRLLRRLLTARVGTGVPDSVGVAEVLGWIVDAGLPAPICGFEVAAGGRRRVLDMAYPAEKIAIEYHGWSYHQMRSRMDDDHARTTELELLGWLVIVVTAAHGRAATVGRIAQALAMRPVDETQTHTQMQTLTSARTAPAWSRWLALQA